MIASAQQLLSAGDKALRFSSATHILDLGCGPGTLTTELIAGHSASLPADVEITTLDSSVDMTAQVLAFKAREIEKDGPTSLWNRVNTANGDAQNLSSISDNTYSHILAGLMLFLLPDSAKALAECHRILKPGGVLALSCWPKTDWQALMSLLPEVRPDKSVYSVPPSWRNEESVSRLVRSAKFRDVAVETGEVRANYADPALFCGWIVDKMPGLQPALADVSAEDKDRLKKVMVSWLERRENSSANVAKGQCLVCMATK